MIRHGASLLRAFAAASGAEGHGRPAQGLRRRRNHDELARPRRGPRVRLAAAPRSGSWPEPGGRHRSPPWLAAAGHAARALERARGRLRATSTSPRTGRGRRIRRRGDRAREPRATGSPGPCASWRDDDRRGPVRDDRPSHRSRGHRQRARVVAATWRSATASRPAPDRPGRALARPPRRGSGHATRRSTTATSRSTAHERRGARPARRGARARSRPRHRGLRRQRRGRAPSGPTSTATSAASREILARLQRVMPDGGAGDRDLSRALALPGARPRTEARGSTAASAEVNAVPRGSSPPRNRVPCLDVADHPGFASAPTSPPTACIRSARRPPPGGARDSRVLLRDRFGIEGEFEDDSQGETA